jgi:UDP-2,3-diacylglucosamine pyrophosphatase LpxH
MDSKSLKIASSVLIVLILSSALGFPLNFKISIAQAMSTAENVARRIALEGPSNELDGEGVFYCSTPIKLDNGKYEYYLWITNPKNKKIRISFNEIVEAEYHIKAPVSISYWEPQFPENNVEVKGNILSTTDQNIFRVIQLDREAILNVEQEGGDPIRVQNFGECSKFLAIILYTINKVAEQAFEDPKYVAAERQLENAIIQTIDNLLLSLSKVEFQDSEVKISNKVFIVGDTDISTPQFENVRNMIIGYLESGTPVVIVGDMAEKHAKDVAYLTLDEIKSLSNHLTKVKDIVAKTGIAHIYVLGNHELNLILTGKYRAPSAIDGAAISPELADTQEAKTLIEELETKGRIAVKSGRALFIHNLNEDVLNLMFKHNLIGANLKTWLDAIKTEYGKKTDAEALDLLVRMLTKRAGEEPKERAEAMIKLVRKFKSEFEKRGINIIFMGHDSNYPGIKNFVEVDGIKLRNVWGQAKEFDYNEVFLGRSLTQSNVEVPDENGNKKSMSFRDALKYASGLWESLKKRWQAWRVVNDYVRVIELPQNANEFAQNTQTNSKKVSEAQKVVQDKIQSGELPQEDAKPIADALSKAQNAINSNDPNSYILAVDEARSNVNMKKGELILEIIGEFQRALILTQEDVKVRREKMLSLIEFYLHTCSQLGSSCENLKRSISDLIAHSYESGYITKEERDTYMSWIEEPVDSQIKKFDDALNSEADGKKAANVVNEQIKKEGVSEALNNVEKQSSNIKSSQIAWYKSDRAQNFANKLLNLEKKISGFESKISIKIFNIKNEVVKLGGFAITFAIPIISSLLNDYFENNVIAQLAISSINLLFATYLVRFFFQVAVLIISVITGVKTVAALASAGIGFVIGLAVGIVAIVVFCFFNPNSTICLCNFRSAQYAISQKGVDPSYYKDKLDEKLKPDLTYYLYAIKVSGHGCNGVEYELEVKSSKSYTYPNKLRIGCMGEKDCAGSMEVEASKIANNIDCYEACDINLKPPFDIFNPATWQSVYLGKITIDKSPVYPVIISNFVKTSDYSCSIEYENKLEESLALKVYIVEPESSKVIDSKGFTIPAKGKGNLNVHYSQPKKKFYLQIFKSSDKNMENPIFTPPLVCG